MHQNSLKKGELFLILLNDGWMVDLAMGSFGFLTIFLIFWHPWDPWICIRSVCWKWNLKQIEAIPPSVCAAIPFQLFDIWWSSLDKINDFKAISRTVFFHFGEINKSLFWVLSKKIFFNFFLVGYYIPKYKKKSKISKNQILKKSLKIFSKKMSKNWFLLFFYFLYI